MEATNCARPFNVPELPTFCGKLELTMQKIEEKEVMKTELSQTMVSKRITV